MTILILTCNEADNIGVLHERDLVDVELIVEVEFVLTLVQFDSHLLLRVSH